MASIIAPDAKGPGWRVKPVHARPPKRVVASSEDAYKRAGDPKELVIVPGAGHVDLYDRVNLIPFAKLTEFFRSNLK